MLATKGGEYGWNANHSCHRLPGRMLITVPGLRGDATFGSQLQSIMGRWRGVHTVRASCLTGRVLVRFDGTQVDADSLTQRVLALGDAHAGKFQDASWTVGGLVAFGGRSPQALLRLAQRAALGDDPHLGWIRPVGRRVLRRTGKRGFRAARAMQQRGEHVVCLLKNGRPAGVLGLHHPAHPHGYAEAAAAASQVAATVEADLEAPIWHTLSSSRTVATLGTRLEGLSPDEAEHRLAHVGHNALPRPPRPSPVAEFVAQCKEPMALLLLASAGISLALGQLIDATVIVGIVIVNALLAAAQNGKAYQALNNLGPATPPAVEVMRGGNRITLPAEQLVPGDVVYLESGDRVPADVRLLDGANLSTLEAPLTGESVDVPKNPRATLDASIGLGDRSNMAFMGTFVRQGRGHGVVVATGSATEMGRVAQLLETAKPGPTPLQRRLAAVNRYVVIGALACSVAMLVFGLAQGHPVGQLLVTAISTAVAAIPEGLPITVSVALALAVSRMGRRNAVVRHLPAVETLGCTTVICTDKTGTLTQNRMSVQEIWASGQLYAFDDSAGSEGRFVVQGNNQASHNDLLVALRTATLCSNASLCKEDDGSWSATGDPTEGALLIAAARAGLVDQELKRRDLRLHESPFDPAVRWMSVTCRDESGAVYSHVKGAPDALLDMCTHQLLDGEAVRLKESDRERILDQANRMASGMQRVLAVGYRPLPDTWTAPGQFDLPEDLIFVGLFALKDPPRPEVFASLQKCRRAGIKVMMTTGDHLATAVAIAQELGMMEEGERALTGADIDRMNDFELAQALEHTTVCARVAPEQKLRIVRLLQARGHVVAMTGDGVNDAPAVRVADIGVAMGRTGAEITRAAADMELLDDHFATIVHAVHEGRGTFDNIRRTVRYTLATNIAEVVLMLGAVLVGVPLPLLPVQLLWINLVCDGLPALALAFDHPAPGCMERPPKKVEEGLFGGGLWARMATRGAVLGLGTLFLFGTVLGMGNVVLARSVAMASLVAGKLLYLFEVRNEGDRAPRKNGFLRRAVALSWLLFLGTLYIPALGPLFGVTSLGMVEWAGVIAVTGIGMALEHAIGKRLSCVSTRLAPA